jgi:arginase
VAGRISRQINKIVIIGTPTSAGAAVGGSEKAPGQLRAAGLAASLREAGFEVADLGDSPITPFQTDDENPRARNLRNVIHAIESLSPLVERAVKTGGLPLILGGDCTIALATLAGLKRTYRRALSLFYLDRDPDLNVPATSPSGFLDGMTVAHIAGRGAAELMRFLQGEPLAREPEIVVFGIARLDPAEQEWLWRSPLHSHKAEKIAHRPPAETAREALEEIHGHQHEFLLHLDADVISQDEMPAVDHPGAGGLGLKYVEGVVTALAGEQHLAAIEVTGYNPERDSEGRGAQTLVRLITNGLKARLAIAPKEDSPASTEAQPVPELVAMAEKSLVTAASAATSSDPASVPDATDVSEESCRPEILPDESPASSHPSGAEAEDSREIEAIADDARDDGKV